MGNIEFKTPFNIEELIYCLKEVDENTFLLSGGTDLVIKLRNQNISKAKLIDMSKIEELNYIKVEEGYIKIGANATFSKISDNEIIRKHANAIYEVASQVGSTQIRNIARMAGNIANASPGGDSIPALECMEAKVKILNSKGEYTLKTIPEIVVGIGKNTLEKDEAIIEILIPHLSEEYRSAFGKYGISSRTTVIIANISVSMIVKYDKEKNLIKDAKVVLGAAAPVMYHAIEAEKFLVNKTPSNKLGEEFGEILQQHVKESIKGVKIFECKIDAVKGLGMSVYDRIFKDVL
ncbi:FAD binding domain-containing protein [Natronincola ferrireducens]|uniref:Carbon-monoxide dehydrogenase medium subunit n=1 Tax=Natronincola ferrireducens TaxID=393762 RepID=A0A1G8Y7Q6_9FIRM|nr:FAD binding domain-containing protein [Natronincola ferrireducens]SDJ98235.1 carbon-monoxide dehydrogenase medium subunit [Natronincola ferrireducens]